MTSSRAGAGPHEALWVGAVVAIGAAAPSALLIRGPRRDEAKLPGDVMLETS